MCGRYTLTASPQVVQAAFHLTETPDLSPRYNIAPTQLVPIITGEARDTLTWVKWGLIPPWSKDASGASQLINARAETVEEKPSFRSAFKKRRCLIPADGFYEWRKEGDKKKPQYIYLGEENQDREVFAFAGLWETWSSPAKETVYTCTIITGEPNEVIKPLHHRMAVILPPESYSDWLDEDTPLPILKNLLTPYPPETMHTYEVSTLVNNARVDQPDLLEPNTPPQQSLLM